MHFGKEHIICMLWESLTQTAAKSYSKDQQPLVFLHVSQLIVAGIFKLSYVVRLVAQK